MNTVTSHDGTQIAFDEFGTGQVVILVTGALGHRGDDSQQQLAKLLAEHLTAINYDRRGRGDSTDTSPYAVEREIEDIEALIDYAGGRAFVYGMSSGAILALKAAKHLTSKISKVALYEPPFILDDSRPPLPSDYVEQLQAAIANDNRSDAVEIFMRQAILIPDEFLAYMKADAMWAGMEKVAHTLAYDGMVSRDMMTGQAWADGYWSDVSAETLIITGENSESFFHTSAQLLASDLSQAQTQTLIGQDHNVDVSVLAPELISFFTD